MSHSQSSQGVADDYCDPWDAKKAAVPSDRDDYSDPWDAQKKQPAPDNKADGKDDYCDPWDSTTPLKDQPKESKGKGKDDYCDPWDAKKPAPKVLTPAVDNPANTGDSDDESYCEPYDTGRVAALDEQAKKMSLKGMRLSSHESVEEEKVWKGRPPLLSGSDDSFNNLKKLVVISLHCLHLFIYLCIYSVSVI